MRSFVALFAVAVLLLIPIAVGIAAECVAAIAPPSSHLSLACSCDVTARALVVAATTHFRAPPATR